MGVESPGRVPGILRELSIARADPSRSFHPEPCDVAHQRSATFPTLCHRLHANCCTCLRQQLALRYRFGLVNICVCNWRYRGNSPVLPAAVGIRQRRYHSKPRQHHDPTRPRGRSRDSTSLFHLSRRQIAWVPIMRELSRAATRCSLGPWRGIRIPGTGAVGWPRCPMRLFLEFRTRGWHGS